MDTLSVGIRKICRGLKEEKHNFLHFKGLKRVPRGFSFFFLMPKFFRKFPPILSAPLEKEGSFPLYFQSERGDDCQDRRKIFLLLCGRIVSFLFCGNTRGGFPAASKPKETTAASINRWLFETPHPPPPPPLLIPAPLCRFRFFFPITGSLKYVQTFSLQIYNFSNVPRQKQNIRISVLNSKLLFAID